MSLDASGCFGFGAAFCGAFVLGMDHLRRQAQRLAGGDAVGGLGALAVQPHFALAQQFFQQRMGHVPDNAA